MQTNSFSDFKCDFLSLAFFRIFHFRRGLQQRNLIAKVWNCIYVISRGLSSHRTKRSPPNAFFQIFCPLPLHVKLTKLAKSEKNVFLFVYLFLLKSFGSVTRAHWGESVFKISSQMEQRFMRKYYAKKSADISIFCPRLAIFST